MFKISCILTMIGTHKLSSIFNLRWYITIKEFYKSKSLILVDEVEVHTIAKGLLKYKMDDDIDDDDDEYDDNNDDADDDDIDDNNDDADDE